MFSDIWSKTLLKRNLRIYDVSIETDNLGDDIIMQYARKEIEKLFPHSAYVMLPTHRPPTDEEFGNTSDRSVSLICGTNILCPDVQAYNLWKMPTDPKRLKNVVFMGVGENSYGTFTEESIRLYKRILSKRFLHSARDTYTYERMVEMGIRNVLDTGCLTMWDLTPKHCRCIPKSARQNAVFTLTGYKSESFAKKMVQAILENYQDVFFWPQGDQDLRFFKSIDMDLSCIKVLPRTLNAFNEVLSNPEVDYVGTRLHGGIHALNKFRRAIIIEVDNRAIEIAKSTKLPTLHMDQIDDLGEFIRSDIVFDINMPWDNIETWRNQWIS